MKKYLAMAALSLVLGCNSKPAPSPAAIASPGRSTNSEAAESQQAKEILAKAKERATLLSERSESNGFLDIEVKLDEIAKTLEPIVEVHDAVRSDGETDLKEALAQTPNLLEPVKAYQKLLEDSLAKPQFHPLWTNDVDAPGPNLFGMRRLSRGILLVGLEKFSQGDHNGALEQYLLSLDIGLRLSGQGNLLNQAVAQVIIEQSLDFLANLLNSGTLTADQYKQVLAKLDSTSSNRADFRSTFELELVLQNHLFDRTEAGDFDQDGEEASKVLSWPAERKALDMALLADRKGMVNLQASLPETEALLKKMEANPTIILAKIALPSFTGFYRQWLRTQSRITGVKILAALQLNKLENKTYPASLDKLAPKYLKELPKNPLGENGAFLYKIEGESFTLSDGAKEKPHHFHP